MIFDDERRPAGNGTALKTIDNQHDTGDLDAWHELLGAAGWIVAGLTAQGEEAYFPPGVEGLSLLPYLIARSDGNHLLAFQADHGQFRAGKDYSLDTVRRMIAPTAGDRAARINDELERMRARRDARRLLDAETSEDVVLPAPVRLDDFLAVVDPDPEYRIDGLLPTGGNAVLSAQYKAGKSTVVANVVRSAADGDSFLGRHSTRPAAVTLIDDELDPRTLRRWLADQHIRNERAVTVVNLRGQLGSFNILDDQVRARWAVQLRGAEVLILDCLRPVLDALGLDENHDAGRFLVALDALKAEAAVQELIVVHHMGHSGERSRGDSRILDWPDAIWKLVRERPDDPDSPRYFSAIGRDVDARETRLDFDPLTRRLTASGDSRRTAAVEIACDAVAELLGSDAGGMTQHAIELALKESGIPRSDVREALHQLQVRGRTVVVPAARNAKKHVLLPDLASSPDLAGSSPANAPTTSPPPI